MFKANPKLNGKENLDNFINYARQNLTLYDDQEFEGLKGWNANKWQSLKTFSRKRTSMVFGFSHSKNRAIIERTFEEPFMSFAKAYVRHNQSIKELANIESDMRVLKFIYLVMEKEFSTSIIDVLDLDGNIQQKVEHHIRSLNQSESLKCSSGNRLVKLYDFLRKSHISPSLPSWKAPFKNPSKHDRIGKVNDKWLEERCPTNFQMLAFAQCFANAKTKVDKYYTSLGVLLCHAPSRNTELTSLSLNPLQKDGEHYYLQWYGVKGFGAKREPVLSYMLPVVKEAIKRLTELSEPARKIAKWAHDNPNIFYRHEDCSTPVDFKDNEPLNPVQFANAIGSRDFYTETRKNGTRINHPILWSRFAGKWIKELREKNNDVITYDVLGKYLYQKYSRLGWTTPNSDRPIWESLLLVRERELDLDAPSALQFSWTIPPQKNLNYELGTERINGSGGKRSNLWNRFGLKDEDGTELKLTSHQFRVWLNTHAQRAGVGDVDIALWSGRASPEQNAAYDLRTEEEIQSGSFELMSNSYNERPTNIQLAKMNLPIEAKSIDVDIIGTVEYTDLGVCSHDYGASPCLKCGECITCKEFSCMKGFPKSLERLKSDAEDIIYQLKKAKETLGEIDYGKDRWATNMAWKLVHYLTFIKALEDESLPEGTVLRIPAHHDPEPIRRELINKGLLVENYDEADPINKSLADEQLFKELLELKI